MLWKRFSAINIWMWVAGILGDEGRVGKREGGWVYEGRDAREAGYVLLESAGTSHSALVG